MVNITGYETSRGEKRWRVRYRKPDGAQTDKREFKRKRDAEAWAAEHVTIAKATGSYIDPRAGVVTIGDLYERWMAVRRPLLKRTTVDTDERTWRTHVAPRWSKRRIGSVTQAEVQQWASRIAGQRSASTTLKAVGVLRGVCDMAVKNRLIGDSPCDGLELPKRSKRSERRRYLTVPQLLAFANAAGHAELIPRERRALVLTLGFTGIRWGEASALTVRCVDFRRRRLHIDANLTGRTGRKILTTPKNHEIRDVPMPEIVADALREITMDMGEDDRVFHDPGSRELRYQSASASRGNRAWWPSALKRAGLPLLSPHDLRHTFASIAVQAGANVKALQRMLGHSSAAMTLDVYADLFDSDLDEVALAVDAAVRSVECGQNVGKG